MFRVRRFPTYIAALALAFSALTISTENAQAQDGQADRWSGLSLSVGAGAKSFDRDVTADLSRGDFGCLLLFLCGLSIQDGQASLSEDDWEGFGTAQIAFDRKMGNFVIGVFADLDFGQDHSATTTVNGLDFNICGVLGRRGGREVDCPVPADGVVGQVQSEVGTTWTIGGRLGYLVSPTWLVYGLVAYSETDLKVTGLIGDPFPEALAFAGDQPTNASYKTEISGLTLGAGTEFAIARNVNFKIEYRYTDFDSESFSASSFNIVGDLENFQLTQEDVNVNVDSEVHSVRAAIVLKLGDPMQAFQ